MKSIPLETLPADELITAGFVGLHFENLGDIHRYTVDGVELRQMQLAALKHSPRPRVGIVMFSTVAPLTVSLTTMDTPSHEEYANEPMPQPRTSYEAARSTNTSHASLARPAKSEFVETQSKRSNRSTVTAF